jgi:SnoaL-like domain
MSLTYGQLGCRLAQIKQRAKGVDLVNGTPEQLAAGYFDAWEAGDPERLRPLIADDVSFHGPLAQVQGADDYISSIDGLFGATDKIVIHRRWVDADSEAGTGDVLTWFDLHVRGAPPAPVASWIHVEDGAIQRVQVTFDPRGMLAAAPS